MIAQKKGHTLDLNELINGKLLPTDRVDSIIGNKLFNESAFVHQTGDRREHRVLGDFV